MSPQATLVENLRRSAATWPDACAIQHGEARITYASLLAQASAVACQLAAHDLKRGDRVALAMSNGTQFVAAYYGALMAGAIVVLLNAAAKARDFKAWLTDCGARFVFADAANREIADAAAQLTDVPRIWRTCDDASRPFGFAPQSTASSAIELREDDAACILYTSGTTGHPKGVVLSHRNLASNTAAIVDYLELTHTDRVVTVLPFYYSYGSSVLHTHVRAGGCLVIEENLVYPHAVVETLARERGTGFAGVPSTFALLLARVKLADYDLSALRYVTQAGGAMSPSLVERLRAVLPHTSLFIMYGQTEATARLTYLSPQKLQHKLGSVGIPVNGVEIQIRDEHSRPLPRDTEGEVWVRGPNVMLGYWRNEAATREVLQDGWLKTGDMGRLDADGFLFLVGRRSDMIKAGAHRVHPQDIEDVIAELPNVQEVAIVGIEDELLGQTIKAFVVPRPSCELNAMQVQAHCKSRLANYKIPKTVEIVSSLPRTASGKIRRIELMQRNE